MIGENERMPSFIRALGNVAEIHRGGLLSIPKGQGEAARALGLSNRKIMVKHLLPNAMVATLTMMPFIITGAIGGLAALDFLGLGLPPSYPSLGELALQGKNNITMPWLGLTAFIVFAVMLSLLVFIFEGVRDAYDPRKTFR